MRNLFSKSRLLKFLARAARDKRGVTAVAFAITFAVLAPMSLGIFDVYTMSEQHGKLQDALDAATLYAARSNAFTSADVNTVVQKALTAALDRAAADLGPIEVLVYSPLPQQEFLRPVLETTVDDLRAAAEFSILGPVTAVRQVLPGMRAAGRGSRPWAGWGCRRSPWAWPWIRRSGSTPGG